MAKRRVNKNLVAFLTIMGIVLSVSVVAVATYQNARKDPEVYARMGRDLEQRGDHQQAVDRFVKAYSVNNEVKYLIDASRCAYRVGALDQSISMLMKANAQQTRDADVLRTLLDQLWEIRRGGGVWREIREYADKLLEIEPNDAEALVYKATALKELVIENSSYAEQADEALARAVEIDPHHPIVAVANADAALNKAFASVRNLPRAQRREAALKAIRESGALEIIQASVDKNPSDDKVVLAAVSVLTALERDEEARATLSAALERMPDDPDLQVAMARELSRMFDKQRAEMTPEQISPTLADIQGHLDRAIELEPAMYEAYVMSARMALQGDGGEPASDAERIENARRGLKILEDAIASSVGLKSVRATLNSEGRAVMHLEAFDMAMRLVSQTPEGEQRKAALDRAREVYNTASTVYAEWPYTHYMKGQLEMIDGNARAAIAAFEAADSKTGGKWRLPRERLAGLYHQDQQYGLALKFTESAIASYAEEGAAPPMDLIVRRVDLLLTLNQPENALHAADDQLRITPGEERLVRLKARALNALDRSDEAQQVLAGLGGASQSATLDAARIAAGEGDYKTAEATLRPIVEQNPSDVAAVTLLMRVMTADGRQAEAASLASQLRERVSEPSMKRFLQAYEVALTAATPEERDAKLLELIQQAPDAYTRASELYSFYVEGGRDYKKAAEQLAEMVRLRPDSLDLVDRQFMLSLMMNDLAAAEKYALPLTRANLDQAGGATYRGRIEMARGNFDKAVTELRSAERLRPSDSGLKALIGQAMLASGSAPSQEAIETLKSAVEINPLNLTAHKLLFSAYEQSGARADAIRHLTAAAQLAPNDPFVVERRQLIDEENDPRKGIEVREARRKSEPENVPNLLRLSELYERVQDTVRAEECLKAALQVEPDRLQSIDLAAGFYARQGRMDEARSLLQDYLGRAQGRDKVRGHFMLASLASFEKDSAAVFQHYRNARQTAEGFADAKEKQAALAEIASETARYCSQHGLTEEMVDALRTALDHLAAEETAQRQRTTLSLIDGLLTLNRQADARARMDEYLKAWPSETRGRIMHSELLARERKYTEAARVLDGVISDLGDSNHTLRTYALYQRGMIHLDNGDLSLARRDLEEAKRVGPGLFEHRHRLALATVLESLGDHALAAVELQQIIEAAPDNREAADRLMQLYRRRGQFEEAQRVARELMRKQPRSGYWPFALGGLFVERGEFSAAVEPLRAALNLSASAPTGTVAAVAELLLRALNGAGRYAEAIQGFESLPPELQLPPVRGRAAEAYYRNGAKEKGIAQFEQAVRDGVKADNWTGVAGVVAIAQETLAQEDTVRLFRRMAEEAEPADSIAYQTVYAQVLFRLNRKEEFEALVDPLVERTAVDSPWRLPVLQLKADMHRSDPEKLVEIYRQMIEANESAVLAMNNLAFILSDRLNRPKEALEYAERAAQLNPSDPDIKDTLGWVRFLNGDLAGAELALRDALRLSPSNVPARYHLGRIFIAKDLKTAAAAELQRALDDCRRSGDRRYEARIEEALNDVR